MLIALLGISTILHPSHRLAPDSGIVVKAAQTVNEWVMPVEIDGKRLEFLLDDAHGLTTLSTSTARNNGFDLSVAHSFTVSGNAIAKTPISSETLDQDPRGRNGALRLDVLRNCALGFDFAKSEITIWPEGGIGPEAADAWVNAAHRRMGSVAAPKVIAFPLEPDPDFVPAIRLGTKGKPWLCRILLSASESYMPRSAVASIPHQVLSSDSSGGHYMTATAAEIPTLRPWCAFDSGNGPWDGEEPEEGCVGVSFLNSQRVLIDFVRRRLTLQRLDPVSSSAKMFSKLVDFPMYTTGRDLRVGPLSELPYCTAGRLGLHDGDRILSFRGLDAKRIVNLIMKGDSCTPKDVLNLYRAIHGKPHKILVNQASGVKEFNLG